MIQVSKARKKKTLFVTTCILASVCTLSFWYSAPPTTSKNPYQDKSLSQTNHSSNKHVLTAYKERSLDSVPKPSFVVIE